MPSQPLHRSSLDPGSGVATKVTKVPPRKPAEQVPPQSMPNGLLATVPEPTPFFVTVILLDGSNLAVTVDAPADGIVTPQLAPIDKVQPLQPANT
jgi:hypothetical protein